MMDESDDLKADMSPSEAAAYATGESAEGHAAAEGFEPEAAGGERPFWLRALRSQNPNPPIEHVGGLRDIREHWEAYGIRGIQKIGGVDDAEAWIDLVKFAIGAFLEASEGRANDEAGEARGERSGQSDANSGALPQGPAADKPR